MFLKSIYMFLKCSWIVLKFSLQKSLATLEKSQKFEYPKNKNGFCITYKNIFYNIFFEGISFSEKRKIWQKIVGTSFNNLF